MRRKWVTFKEPSPRRLRSVPRVIACQLSTDCTCTPAGDVWPPYMVTWQACVGTLCVNMEFGARRRSCAASTMREALLACLGMMTVAGQFIDAEAPEPKLTAQFARMLQTSDNATVFIDPSPEPSPSPSPEGEPVCINTCMYSSVRERTLLHIICAQRMSKRCVCSRGTGRNL